MLQWTGGSRRQVYASRKSTQSRQRQYFEQKKRQQHTAGLQNQDGTDGAGGQAVGDQAPRSLDILSLNNLAAPVSQRNGPENADSVLPHMDSTHFSASPLEALKKIISSYNIDPRETSSQPRLSSPVAHQDVAAAVNPHEDPLARKISTSNNYDATKRNPNVDLNSGEISLIDLVRYEGSKNKSTAQPARESHVSFSVKGLGHVKMETPLQSPRSTKRTLPLPPKASRYTQNKSRRSIPFDTTKGLDSLMYGISMMRERSTSHKMGSLVDESSYVRRENCYFSHSFENYNDNLYAGDEDMFCKPQAPKGWQSNCSRRYDGLPDVNSDHLWNMESFDSDAHFPTPRAEHFDTVDYGVKERYSPERRTSTRTSIRFETSGHDLFSDQSLLDDDIDMLQFDWERQPSSKKIHNTNITFGPSAWSSDMVDDDSEKRKSPLSEESSSCAAVKDISSNKPTLSVKCTEKNMNEKDDFHASLDKSDIPNIDAHLDEMSAFRDEEEYYKRATDQKNREADYWPDKAMGQQRTQEPSCRLSLQEKFADWGSCTSHLKGSTRRNNPPSCTVMREDKPFDSIPDMGGFQTVGSTEWRPTSKVRPVFHRPDSAYDEIHPQNPVSDLFGNTTEFSDPFRATDLPSNIDMCTFLGQKAGKKKEDNFYSLKKSNADIFHSASSVNETVVGQHTTYSQQSGKDSLRQGFDPGIDFQESRLHSFWEDGHVSDDTFRSDNELNNLLARKNDEKNKGGTERLEKLETKTLTQASKPSGDFGNEMSEAETCSDGSEVTNYPGVQNGISAAATQLPGNLCLEEASRGIFQIHAQVDCARTIENPGVDFEAPVHVRNIIHDDGDHTKANPMFQSPFMAEKVGIEKKVISGVSSSNSDIQFEVMLERRVLRRFCLQKVVVETPMKDKLDKVTHFRTMEDGTVLRRSV
ncbi:uncharacterized protein LOC123442831 isoform X2 [Hordeum vulgare subsp. vulgare]|uniref:uncharacterized protein LOC123442831 isoform X2 n=1 Tax=Hordeum vulgare subsp. vulgare TaxID=112509 RepID=UPI001B84DD51|nr:uncharacterized protein LOC123442831 isoform X2 [Hordeum vulgare subsp. vulgare]